MGIVQIILLHVSEFNMQTRNISLFVVKSY